MSTDVEKWLLSGPEAILRRIGVEEGGCVLDFGCGEGKCAIPAGRIVSQTGRVYAVDKDEQALEKVKRAAEREGLRNIEVIHVAEDEDIPLPDETADVVLLYDILHGGYFSDKAPRIAVLRRVYNVLKPGGFLSCYLTHLREYRLTFGQMLAEIRSVGFRLDGESRRRLVHSGRLVRGRIFRFVKPL